jgi:hypothetical protein
VIKFKGKPPEEYSREKIQQLADVLNHAALNLERDLVGGTPFDTGRLKGGWVMTPASVGNPVAIVGQSLAYFLSVEMGRAPGKGISIEGQGSVAKWAKRKLGLSEEEAMGLASGLSRKYQKFGRPAVGFVGLAKPGKVPGANQPLPERPIKGSLLEKAFSDLRAELQGLG